MISAFLCALALAASDGGADAPDAAVVVAPAATTSAADYAAKLDELWKTRDDATSIKAIDTAISEGLKAFPEDYELLWRAARARWWTADGCTEAQEKLKKQLGKEAWILTERALKVKPGAFEGKYYTALAVGAYSEAVGIMKALSEGLEGKFNENLDAVIKINDAYDNSGPRRAKGRYFFSLPWPKRDLGKAKDELDKALKATPQALRTHLYLAEVLLKDGKAKEAKVEIDKVLKGDISYDPPEGRRVQKWAKPISDKIDEELK